MDFTTLGRTGLRVSVAGLGSGGPSRLGQETGASVEDGVALIRRAVDLGVNLLDTAQSYGTEGIVGAALKQLPRESVILSTKQYSENVSADGIVEALDESLRALGTDYLDVFHLHGVLPDEYDRAVDELVPALLRERERGKFRFLGITERTSTDPDHVALTRALDDDCWDVMMISFNLMHQGARARLLPDAKKRGLGTLIMAPARCRVSAPARLAAAIKALAAEGVLAAELGQTDDPLGFLIHHGGAESLMDAAYRFARHQSEGDVILFGTGNPDHLEANIASLLRPPLPEADIDRLTALFGHLKGIGLDQGRGYPSQAP
ncbi:MAG: aldo/keto reductase [Alphaproteobacteria bacterium]|nr:aldo/keto reductase [Alphaproteobacteria bacterium]